MELKEFIATGIIESYLLGTATQQEVEVVHSMLNKYPELQNEINAIEDSLLKIAETNSLPLNEKIKEKVLATIRTNQNGNSKTETAKVVAFTSSKKRTYINYVLVASLILLIGSTVINIIMFSEGKKMTGEMARLNRENEEMKTSITTYMGMVNNMQKELKVLTDTNSKMIRLKGMTVSPASLATVCWNQQSSDVYLYVNNLPDPPVDMQYQLWAIVDGKPVDAGVFETGKGDRLQNMLKTSGTPQAFAVTLEKKGGSINPNLEAMFLLGEV